MWKRSLLHMVIRLCVIGLLTVLVSGLAPAHNSAAAAPSDWVLLSPTLTQLESIRGAESAAQGAPSCASNVVIIALENGRYVSAELGYKDSQYAMLRARANAIGPWEKFILCADGISWTLQSQANGLYVSAELGYKDSQYAMLRARAKAIGPWERFDLLRNTTTGAIAIRSQANTRYVSAELGYKDSQYAMLRARATVIAQWEQFLLGQVS